ncbi:RNA-guided endonuclease InsQ/TnpB family protein [Halorussus halophilus]|uniref:RNA-guided endonuclease InsQ/TnpB family protein n=1 Tax=Halorussus halophilus TaxID=2650975 RepID=UPI0013013704|nr:RNA-guided endonuclease TnpB family protein [Halorussus halophilus]
MAEEYQRRTAITRLQASEEQSKLLEQTISDYTKACQLAGNKAWPDCTSKRRVQSVAYDSIRDTTGLGSQHAILASHQAATAVAACQSRLENGYAASKPSFTAPTIRYDSRTMTLFEDGTVSLSTIESRIRCSLVLPSEADGYQHRFLESDSWELTESTLTRRDGGWFLHLGFRGPRKDTEDSTVENGTVLGVDLGIENLAVTSTGRFGSGAELTHVREQYEQRRSNLQKTGTRSAHRTLSTMSRRERRFANDTLHCTSNELVEEAQSQQCGIIAFENLEGITDRLPGATTFHTWAFRRLREFVEYKAEEVGIRVVTVNPRNTSKQCSQVSCESVSAKNRPVQHRFECTECGYEVHADYNAAKNIGLRAVRDGHKSSSWTGVSQCALKSGAIAPSGEYFPHHGDKERLTDKPSQVDGSSERDSDRRGS